MSNAKDIRKQIRNVLDTELNTLLTDALVEALRKELTLKLEARLDAISAHLKTNIEAMQAQQDQVSSYILRNTGPTRKE